MSLIEKDEALKRVEDAPVLSSMSLMTKSYIYAGIKTMPDVDAVPVVRCKNCEHWCTDSTPCLQDADVHFCPMVDFYSTADWFCAYGESRKEEGNA
jgi:hypothetical protein